MNIISYITSHQGDVIFVNGIDNPKPYAKETAQLLTQKCNKKVKSVWNQLGPMECHRSTEDERVRKCVEKIKSTVLNSVKRNRKLCFIAHSKGCDIVLTALKEVDEVVSKININQFISVFAFGGTTLIPKHYGDKVINYMALGEKTIFGNRLKDLPSLIGGAVTRGYISGFRDFLKTTFGLERCEIESWNTIESSPNKNDYHLSYIETPINSIWDIHHFRKSYMSTAADNILAFKKEIENRRLKKVAFSTGLAATLIGVFNHYVSD